MFQATDFEIDANTTVEGAGDWDGVYGPGVKPAGLPTTGVYQVAQNPDGCAPDADDIVVPGTKIADGPIWPSQPGSPPEKDDLATIDLAAEKVNDSGQIIDILYVYFERCSSEPGSMKAFLYLDDGDGTAPSEGDTGGDYLFEFDFNPSGGTAVVARQHNGFDAMGKVIWDPIIIPAGSIDLVTTNPRPDAGEVALNLTALGIFPETACRTVTVGGTGGTIAGGANESTLKDSVVIADFPISNCGALVVNKVSDPPSATSTQPFTYVVDQLDAKPVYDSTVDVSGVNDTDQPQAPNTEIDANILIGQTDTWVNVISQPDYDIAETVIAPGWELATIVCSYYDPFPILNDSNEVVWDCRGLR